MVSLETEELSMSERNGQSWKPNRGMAITHLFAWVATAPDGGESLVGAALSEAGGVTLLIGADLKRVESYRALAAACAITTGYAVSLKRFSAVTVVENPQVRSRARG
jgi:hypothetical protein